MGDAFAFEDSLRDGEAGSGARSCKREGQDELAGVEA